MPNLSAKTRGASHGVPVGMLLLATLCWGLSFPTIKTLTLLESRLVPLGSTWFSTFAALAPRFWIGAILLALWQWRSLATITRKEWSQGIVIGLFAGAGMLWQTDGLQFTAASTSAFLTQFYALLIPVYVAIRTRVPLKFRVGASALLVLAGVAILGHFDFRTFHLGRGEWETLLSSVFFMGQILWLEKKAYTANRPGKITLITFLVQGIFLGGLLLFAAPNSGAVGALWTSSPWVGLTVILTLVSTLAAYGLMNIYQPRITATEAGLIYCVEPIFSSVLALFLPAFYSRWAEVSYANETATAALLVGGGLITIANILVQLGPK